LSIVHCPLSIKKALLIVLSVLSMFSCTDSPHGFDASGSFEAGETIISAEAQGILKMFDMEEGQVLHAGQQIGLIDSTQPYLKKKQLEAQIVALLGKKPDIPLQLSAMRERLKTAEREKERTANLLKGGAATPKQMDDINAETEVLKRKIEAQRSALEISSTGLGRDVVPLRVHIEQLEDQLQKCRIVNPINGTVLAKYADVHEMAAIGKPLYKIADLSNIILRAYVTGNQLAQIAPNQRVTVLTDDGLGGYREATGTIAWISSKAEFTPKTIQTKDERANMVYAVKVRVENGHGHYKIGMYGEILFN